MGFEEMLEASVMIATTLAYFFHLCSLRNLMIGKLLVDIKSFMVKPTFLVNFWSLKIRYIKLLEESVKVIYILHKCFEVNH